MLRPLRLLHRRLARQAVRIRVGYYPPTLQSGEFYVPPLGQESYEFHRENTPVGHLARYAWACRVLAHMEPSAILDVACGCGYGTAKLADAFPEARIIGWDRNRDAVGYARRHYSRPNVRFIRADIASLARLLRPRTFDAMTSFDTIEHLPEPGAFLATARRLLRERGIMLASIPCWPEPRPFVSRWHLFEPTYEEMEALITPHFADVRRGDALPMVEFLRAAEEGRDAVVATPWSPLYLARPRQ